MPNGLTASALARFDETAASHAGDDEIPGLVALVARGDDVHVATAGALSVGGPPIRRDTLFRIASTTKPVTAVATLALAREGLFDLDEPVDRLLPELADRRVLRHMDGPLDDTTPAERPILVRDLLTFTFGFGAAMEMFTAPAPWPVVAAAAEAKLATIGPPSPVTQPDPDAWMAGLGRLPLMKQPGERWLYNTGASVLGVLCARAAEVSFADVLRTRIFEPLAMTDTAFYAADTSRLPTAYRATPDGLVVWDPADGQWSRPPAFEDGAAGLVSTVDDLLAFARMFLRGGDPVLAADDVAEMTRDQTTTEQKHLGDAFLDGRGWGYCCAVDLGGPHAGAFGWDGGLGTSWRVDPARDLVVIVLTQRMFESAQTPQAHRDLHAAAYAAVG